MNRLLFLVKSGSSFLVLLNYCKFKILSIFKKKKFKYYKIIHKKILKKKKITADFFSPNSYHFFSVLCKVKKDAAYLEIGSYEGNSALFVEYNFPSFKIYCVDTWSSIDNIDFDKEYKGMNINEVEKNFDYNIKNKKNIFKIKNTSDKFFENNNLFYDVIYVDGYHLAEQVLRDCMNSWKFLKKNGYLICDDYIWNFYSKIKDNPCFAINQFLLKIKNEFEIILVTRSQIFLKKII